MGPNFETVDERARRTGFIAGPNHRQMSTMDSPKPAEESPAPNYRDGEDGSQCMNCAHYQFDQRMCSKFNFEAKPLKTCDAFEASEGQESMLAPGDGGSMMGEEYE
jgi:hypothetical protein